MPPKRKNSAFLIFCQEYCKSANGKQMQEATKMAQRKWTKMTDEQRQKYQEKANKSATTVTKYTSLGVPITFVEHAEEEIKQYEIKMFENITNTVKTLTAADCLEELNISIFHFNSFCYSASQKRHYPAELAVAKFNLRDGVSDVYHAICNPGPFPLGYAAAIQIKSNETHQLVPDPSAPSNLEMIFYELISFVDDRGNRNKPPPLYVPPNNLSEAKEFLATLCVDYGYDPNFLDVYSLAHLFYQLRNAAAKKTVCQSATLALLEFERDVYEYAPGISCEVHEALGIPNKCSKSIVTRSAYIICDNCCQDLNIKLIPGKHIAKTAKIASGVASSDISDTDVDEKFKPDNNIQISKSVTDEDNATCLHFHDTDEAAASVSSVSADFKMLSLNTFHSEAEADSEAVFRLNYRSRKTAGRFEDGSAPPSETFDIVWQQVKPKRRGKGRANSRWNK